MSVLVSKIIAGGQTGIDRGALDFALAARLPCGGYCPLGRRSEDGRIPARYPLHALTSRRYALRTLANVLAADATLIVHCGRPGRGTLLTRRYAVQYGRPLLLVELDSPSAPIAVRRWLAAFASAPVLNVAGPRLSEAPRCDVALRRLLSAALRVPRAVG